MTMDAIKKALDACAVSDKRRDAYLLPLATTCIRYGITYPHRLAAFLAQVVHESELRLVPIENLNYSSKGLLSVFGKYFTEAEALDYERQPERIANLVYANRMGNGNEASGDGWKYRGRGLIQVTGKINYSACAEALDLNLVDMPDYLLEPKYAAMSAGWFWDKTRLNELADTKDFAGITKRINGGLNGQEHRERLYQLALKVMGV